MRILVHFKKLATWAKVANEIAESSHQNGRFDFQKSQVFEITHWFNAQVTFENAR